MEEVKALHEEWFPLDYPQTFYDRVFKVNVIAVGCFVKPRFDMHHLPHEIILGTILVKVQAGGQTINELY